MPTSMSRAEVVAGLSDLQQLDCDAVANYRLAIGLLRDARHRQTLERFLADHERHVAALGDAIRAAGGFPLPLPHVPTGMLKLGVQAASAFGDDRMVLLAFRSNELQARDRYARAAAAPWPAPIAALIAANSADESRHFDWVSGVLERAGLGEGTRAGAFAAAFAQLHAGTADLMEDFGRANLRAAYGFLRPAVV